ncbi:folylpolyglutamate synthase/dihydrofolate synthase family protein [Actinomycetaceae bacterium MB13-C1-2]|nr:folylpolyglutamate synthase/dihydrofolate synthase family protein [Actinomycetaceae bacterium MB13-C1-2]
MSDSTGAGTGDEQNFDLPHGIDPELIPYLIAADEDDESDDDQDDVPSEGSGEEDEDEGDLEQLRRIVKETLLAGADPELIASILEEDSDEDRGEIDPDTQRIAEHEALLDEAEAEAELNVVYQDLITRTPEHDFDPTLDRVQQVLYILGDPQDAYPILHIAGTNGKTSTTRLSSALLSGFGLRVGAFTSPHLTSVRERIQVNGQPLSAREFLSAWQDVSPYIDMVDEKADEAGTPKISYFEALAITALAAFADIPVDAAVIEVGLGGRFDATNVVNSGVQVITPISFDHQKYLGNTIEEIAGEKAQIIKPGSIVVVSSQDPAALAVIEQRIQETDSIMRLQDRDWAVESRQPGVGGQMISVRTPAALYEELFIPLHGEHQAQNAAAALVAVEAIMGGKALPPEVVEAGFLQARSPGRLEIVRRSPTVIVDAAHNPAGVAAMRTGLAEAFHLDYLVGVFSAMADKNIEAMLVEIEPAMDQIVLTQMQGARPIDIDDLTEIAVGVFGEDRVHVKPDLADALEEAVKLMDAPSDPSLQRAVVAFGSIMLAGDVTALFQR